MLIEVTADGVLRYGEVRVACALGRSGVTADKREGDGATPIGEFPLRRVFYRPDRIRPPLTGLSAHPLNAHDGWCDDAHVSQYNQLVELPFAASHEIMWRDDGLYDVVVEIGYNDAPIELGLGSAIFLHVAKPSETGETPFAPTEGCVALPLDTLLDVLKNCDADSRIRISGL